MILNGPFKAKDLGISIFFCSILTLGLSLCYAFIYMQKGSIDPHKWGVPDLIPLWMEHWPSQQESCILISDLLLLSSMTLVRLTSLNVSSLYKWIWWRWNVIMWVTYHVRDESDCSLTLGQRRESMYIDQPLEMALLGISLQPTNAAAPLCSMRIIHEGDHCLSHLPQRKCGLWMWSIEAHIYHSNHKALVNIITENKNVCVLTKQQFFHFTASLKDPWCVVSCLFLSLEFPVLSPSGWGIQVCPWGTFLRIWASVSSFRKFCDPCLAYFTGLLWRWDSTKERVRRFKALCWWQAWSWWRWCLVVKWEPRAWILESRVFKSKVCHRGAASFPSLGLRPQVWNGDKCAYLAGDCED